MEVEQGAFISQEEFNMRIRTKRDLYNTMCHAGFCHAPSKGLILYGEMDGGGSARPLLLSKERCYQLEVLRVPTELRPNDYNLRRVCRTKI
jgi:hypothetical protein